tara:strand:- start:14946 stop:19064 length:4119 start_codon:yes stop_codon:yes gene_type:complete
VSITNNPFNSTRINDSNVRVLRPSAVTQQLNEDLPLAVQYIKYNDDDFFAVGFNRILKTKVINEYSQVFNLYNISSTGTTHVVKSEEANTHYAFSESAMFAHVRDFLYRPDESIEGFVREGVWNGTVSSAYLQQWPLSQSGTITSFLSSPNPLWIRNSRDGTSAEINGMQVSAGPSGITEFIKVMDLKSEFSRDKIEPGTFALNMVDTNIITEADFRDQEHQYGTRPLKAATFSPSHKDTAAIFTHPSAKTDLWNEYAGSGFTVEIVFRPSEITSRQTLLFKGGVLSTISGGLTAVTENIYEAGTVAVSAGATAVSADSKFNALSANTEGIYYEMWAELSASTLYAGRHLEPQVDFYGNKMSPLFTEFRVDLLSPTAIEIQVGDGNLRYVTGLDGEAFGLGGSFSGGSGSRFAYGGASAQYTGQGASGPPFNLTDGAIHHLIVAWSPTGTSHVMSPVFTATGGASQRGSHSGHIRAYLDGYKLKATTEIQSAKYSVSSLFMAENSGTMSSMYNKIPPVSFRAGEVATVDLETRPTIPYKILDSQFPAEMEGVVFTDAAMRGSSVTACDHEINQFTYGSIRLFDPLTGTISAQIIRPASTTANTPSLSANQVEYNEQVITLSGGKSNDPLVVFPDGGITGSQFARFEREGIGFPEESLDEFTVELFFRTNADRKGASGSLAASRTGTFFSLGGTTRGGLYSPKQIALEYITDNEPHPKIRAVLFDGDEQIGENEHELPFFNLNAFPVTSLSASYLTDPLTKVSLSSWPFGPYLGEYNASGTITSFHDDVGVQLPIYRSTPYIAFSYSKNDNNTRVRNASSLGGFYQILAKQDIGLSASAGIITGDYDQGLKNTLTSLEQYFLVDSNTADQFYSSRSFNFNLPITQPEEAPRHRSATFLNGVANSLTSALIGIADSEFMTFEVEEMRIWRKSLTKKEMQEHAKDRDTLYYVDDSLPPLEEKDLISQFTFNQEQGNSSTILGSTPQRNPYHGLTRRRDSISFPRPDFSINSNNYSGELFELRGWVGALADPFNKAEGVSGNVMAKAGYEVYTNAEDPDSAALTIPDAATANEIGLCFSRVGAVLRRGRLQRFNQYVDNYLPLAGPEDYNSPSITSVKFGNKAFDGLARSPKTHSALALWFNFETSINSKLATDNAHDRTMTLFGKCQIINTGFIQYKDSMQKNIKSELVNHKIHRIAKFGSRILTLHAEQPPVGTIFNDYSLAVWDASDKYQSGKFGQLDFTNYTEDWDSLEKRILSIEYNNVICKAMLQPITIADGTLFNGSQNPTAYDPVTNEYFSTPPSTYVTKIGFYNDSNELMAVANVGSPLRKNEDQTIVFKPLLDFSPSEVMPRLATQNLDRTNILDGGGNLDMGGGS